jgi:hypothetical protein
MIGDLDWWILLLLLILLFLILLLFYLFFRMRLPKPPIVLFEAERAAAIMTTCGNGDVVYTNLTAAMDVNVQLENTGVCTVTLSTQRHPAFLACERNQKKGIAIPLGRNDKISYKCDADVDKKADPNNLANCEFSLKITRI